jgi:hypothetical protein
MTEERSHSGTVVAAVIFAAMASGLVYRYWPSEERSIRRHLNNLAQAISLPYSENEAALITRFAALSEYFARDVRVEIDEHRLLSRDALIGELRQWRPPPGGVVVAIADVRIALTPGERAEVTLTATRSLTDPATGKAAHEQRRLALSLAQVRDDWVITEVRPLG